MEGLEKKTLKELVEVYNELAVKAGKQEIGKWWSNKKALLERVALIKQVLADTGTEAEVAEVDYETPAEAGEYAARVEAATENLPAETDFEAEVVGAAEEEPEKKTKTKQPLYQTALALLLEVDKNGLGLPYTTIAKHLKNQFPESKSNNDCVRAHAFRARKQGIKLPPRPRPGQKE